MQRLLATALMVLSAALASSPVLAQSVPDQSRYWHHGSEWGWGHMLFGSTMMILIWGSVILAIVVAVRWIGSGSQQSATTPASRNKALDILQERFARGEIDKDEFEERRRVLSD